MDKTLELESQFQQSSLSEKKKNLKYLRVNGTVEKFLGLNQLIFLFIVEQTPTLVPREQVIVNLSDVLIWTNPTTTR